MNLLKIRLIYLFVSDFSHRLCKTIDSQERDQWKVQREVPCHTADPDQAKEVREKNHVGVKTEATSNSVYPYTCVNTCIS